MSQLADPGRDTGSLPDRPSPVAVEVARVQVAAIQLARQLKAADASGLATSARTALAALVKYGPVPAGRLAEIEGVDPASISRTLRTLERQGLIRRTTDPTDRRVSLISASPAGTDSFYRSRNQTTDFLVERLAGLTGEELEQILAVAPALELLVGVTA